MQRKQLLIGIFLIMLITGLSACYYDNEEELYGITTSDCNLEEVKYSVQVQSIISTNCYACHSTGSNIGNLLLDSYNSLRSSATNGSLMGSVKHAAGYSAMPQGAAKLKDCDIQALQTWVDAGTPNN